MATISLCMIVKNEEDILGRCIDSLKGIYDEAIIVDTGSSDKTREIACQYTDQVYDFVWVDDFSKARNFAMSKASCDYIYMADADEVIDEENRKKFLFLKSVLDGGVEVVQMNYVNQLRNGSVYNFDREPRAKLYKRIRQFEFVDPIHEVIRESPVVYDSDIDIIHMQKESHSERDLEIFRKAVIREGRLSERLIDMYARELYLAGTDEDFLKAEAFFKEVAEYEVLGSDKYKTVIIILAKIAVIKNDLPLLLKYSLKGVSEEQSSEICCTLGKYFEDSGESNEAAIWYFNARYETAAVLDIRSMTVTPLEGLIRIYESLNMPEQVSKYKKELSELEGF